MHKSTTQIDEKTRHLLRLVLQRIVDRRRENYLEDQHDLQTWREEIERQQHPWGKK